MKDSVKINIGGTDYKLTSDNKDQLLDAAADFNDQINKIRQKHRSDLPQSTVNVLAGLNIAENNIKLKRQINNDQNLIISDINKMIEVLEDALK
jgi:cell division protein ZapA (FtsZ GTPase activity inhibitor)